MIAPQSQSRNYNPENFLGNLDDMLQKIASQRVDDYGPRERTDTKILKEDIKNGATSVASDDDKANQDPQMNDFVDMQDQDYEVSFDMPNLGDRQKSKKNSDEDSVKIKNIETGESYDLSQQEVEAQVNPENCLVLKGVPWSTFWKNIRKSNESLWDASEAGNAEKTAKLLEKAQAYPAEINSKALDDWTALHMAANGGHLEVVRVLIKNDANIEAKTSMARTPLHLSCMRGNRDIISLLVDSGANVNALDNDFCTPLHYASEHGFADVVTDLLDKKNRQPDVSIKNHAGLTCIDVANSFEVRKIFEDRGLVNDKTMSSFGRTCIDDALLYNSRSDMIGRLLLVNNKSFKLEQSRTMHEKDQKKKPESKFSNVVIHDWSNEEAKNDNSKIEKIGPQSFICHIMLGKGSFGEVYLVEKVSSKKLFAMKVLRKDRIFQQNLTRYARTERNVLSIMNHPFIVKLSYAFQTENKLFMLLDYCPGGDLAHAITKTKEKKLKEDVAKIYAAEITLALEALHSKDIIFRDLKPDNVVLDADGHALLTDFGLSKEGVKEGLQKSFCGSVAYLAPEVLRRSGHNKTVDWYLLGVMIYEMLVGEPPYFNPDRETLFDNIKKAQLKLPKFLSEEAKHLITHLLIRDPSKRLGCKTDAAEIKSHPWFRDIDWQDAMDRKLTPPIPARRNLRLNGMENHRLEEESVSDKNRLQGWSFIDHGDF